MKLPRPFRVVAALIALSSMLFMQLAVAAYACPMETRGSATVSVEMRQAMPDCSGMDMQQPSLCAAYAHPGHQSLGKPQLPTVAPFVASGLVATLVQDEVAIVPSFPLTNDAILARSTSPPLAIRHCCFRI
jgi:hypothetical protein